MTQAPTPGPLDWTTWSGGPRPHPPATRVRVRYRDGTEDEGASAFCDWLHSPRRSDPKDVVAYKVIREAPTAPVEASGSELTSAQRRSMSIQAAPPVDDAEAAGCAEPQVGRAVYERIEKLLTTNPQGWERDYLCHLVESVEELGGYDGPRLDGRNDRQAVADFLKLRDENVGPGEADDAERLESADAILALLSARPLALVGQQGEEADAAESAKRLKTLCAGWSSAEAAEWASAITTVRVSDILRVLALSTAPAGAEAQDETAVGEWPEKWSGDCTVGNMIANLKTLPPEMPLYTAYHIPMDGEPSLLRVQRPTMSRERVDGITIKTGDKSVPYSAVIWTQPQDPLEAHASPTPAADADRVREAFDAGVDVGYRDITGRDAPQAFKDKKWPEALAALKSEGE